MKPLSAVAILVVLMFTAVEPATAQSSTNRSDVGQAVHWCLFNRPCNWSGHATIATGIVWGLSRAELRPEYAAVAAALVFVGKEFRDDRKWGNVLGSADSMGDLLSGVAGAYLGYRLFHRSEKRSRPTVSLEMSVSDGPSVGLQILTGPRAPR
ncbi:MAG: hypothetical protein ACREL7_10225 [Longimicrobiales bacterium]